MGNVGEAGGENYNRIWLFSVGRGRGSPPLGSEWGGAGQLLPLPSIWWSAEGRQFSP